MSAQTLFTVMLAIPSDSVGLLIGKSGAHFKQMSEFSGAEISLQHATDILPRSAERALVITGSIESLLKAMKITLSRLGITLDTSNQREIHPEEDDLQAMSETSNRDQSKPRGAITKWIIPQSMCGALIGKTGQGIKKINSETGAWVKVAHNEEYSVDPSER